MSYENAPATELLAVYCALCARPLVDAKSVECGVGPVCRKRHGFGDAQTAPDFDAAVVALEACTDADVALIGRDAIEQGDAHRAANAIVHRVAVEQTGGAVPALATALEALGYAKLAARILQRVCAVQIDTKTVERRVGGGAVRTEILVVRAPYREQATHAWRRLPGRRWDASEKANTVPATRRAKVALWRLLRDHYAGLTGRGPRGLFTIAA